MSDINKIAKFGHDTYERLAPEYGYVTRSDTKEFDPESPNGKLMIAVYGEVIAVVKAEYIAAIDAKKIYTKVVEQPLFMAAVVYNDHLDVAIEAINQL